MTRGDKALVIAIIASLVLVCLAILFMNRQA